MCLQGPGGSSEGSAVAAPVRTSCPAETWGQTQNPSQHQVSGVVYLSSQDCPPPPPRQARALLLLAERGARVHHVPFQSIRQTASLGDFSSSLSSTIQANSDHPYLSTPVQKQNQDKNCNFQVRGDCALWRTGSRASAERKQPQPQQTAPLWYHRETRRAEQ